LFGTAGPEFMFETVQSGAMGYVLLETPPWEIARCAASYGGRDATPGDATIASLGPLTVGRRMYGALAKRLPG
jgi:hypothetical protein